jgi:hypothetical protein
MLLCKLSARVYFLAHAIYVLIISASAQLAQSANLLTINQEKMLSCSCTRTSRSLLQRWLRINAAHMLVVHPAGLDVFICQQLVKHCPEGSLERSGQYEAGDEHGGSPTPGVAQGSRGAGKVHATHPHETAEMPQGAPAHDEL